MNNSSQQDMFSTHPASGGEATKLIFSLEVPGRLPSWNHILGMEQWARYKFKGELANAFLCALKLSGDDSSTKITCAKSTMLTYADTLERYLGTKQAERRLKSAKKRSGLKSQSEHSLKFTKSEVPF